MNEERIEIRKAVNGFIVTETTCEETDDNGNNIFTQDNEVIEEEENEREALRRLLLLIAEKMGYAYDKFGKENLVIRFNGIGHKVETEPEVKEWNAQINP